MTIITSFASLFDFIKKSKKPLTVLPTPLNDLYYLYSSNYFSYYSTINTILPDGVPLVWYLRLFRYQTDRLYGPEVLLKTIKKFRNKKHLVLLSKDTGKTFIAQYCKGLGVQLGELGFSKEVNDLLTTKITKAITANNDFIWIGIGSPKQVQLAFEIRKLNSRANIFCVGAAFNLVTKPELKAPNLLQNLSLEWLFRLVKEPRRLWKRYLFDSPRGLYYLPKILNEKIR
jgi:N-acetylglucosaminyldiphosphoundecaprenol N-acetyl-beta-D-mannosaminyltransferase